MSIPRVFPLLLSACLLLPAGRLSAGAPLKINFQGRLSESGQPAEGSKTFVFKVYDVASGGVPVWEGASQSVALSQGVFSAELSAGTPALSTATFAGARYVEIVVDGVTLAPRQEMVSAPYALVAQALAADAVLPPASIAAGSVTDLHVSLTTAAITSGRFSDDRVLITTGAFSALNGPDQLVKLEASGYLPALNGSALTGVAAASYAGAVAASQLTGVINDNRLAVSTGAFPGGFNGADQLLKLDGSGLIADADIPGLVASKITSGKFYDAQVALSTGAFPGGLNGVNQLLVLDGSGLVPFSNLPALAASQITSGKFYDAQLAVSTGAFPGGFNGADQLLKLDGSALVSAIHIPDLSASRISSGKFYDLQLAVSTGAFPGGFNGADQLLKLDGSGLVPDADIPGLAAAKITSGKFYDAQLAVSTGAFPGGFNAAGQLVKLDSSGRLGVGAGAPNSTFSVDGSLTLKIMTFTSFVDLVNPNILTLGEADNTVLLDGTNNDIEVNLPSAASATGRVYTLKRLDNPVAGGNYTVTLFPQVGESIDNMASVNFGTQWQALTVQSSGSRWLVLSSN